MKVSQFRILLETFAKAEPHISDRAAADILLRLSNAMKSFDNRHVTDIAEEIKNLKVATNHK